MNVPLSGSALGTTLREGSGADQVFDPGGVADISRWSSAASTTGCGMLKQFAFDPGGVAELCDPSGVDHLCCRSSFPVVVASLLYKGKIALTTFLIKAGLRSLLGQVMGRAVFELVTVPSITPVCVHAGITAAMTAAAIFKPFIAPPPLVTWTLVA